MGKYANQSKLPPYFPTPLFPRSMMYLPGNILRIGLPNQITSPFGPQILQPQPLNQFINKSNAPSTPPSHILRNLLGSKKPIETPHKKKAAAGPEVEVTETLTEAVTNSVLTLKLPSHPPTLKEICKGLKKENELMKERINYYDEMFTMLLEKVNGSNVDDPALHLRKSLNSAPTSNPVICKRATSASSSSIKQRVLIASGSSDSPGRPNATKPKPPLLKKEVMIKAIIQVVNALKEDGKKTWGLASKFAYEFHVCLSTISHWVERYSNTPEHV
ncbi:hypothetical protein HK096_006853 [Nowakowskiella sp. JEL0078]|nr:hypothetical protein HK096_006853 [Nowakowskiella sp. JEL0078]